MVRLVNMARLGIQPGSRVVRVILTVMLGLRPRLRVVRLVKTAMSVAGKGHCRLKPRMSRRSSVPLAVQICPGNLHQLVNTPPPGCCALRVFQSEHTDAEPAQQLHRRTCHVSHHISQCHDRAVKQATMIGL